MNNEYKNLGVAFGLSSIIEGLSLTKILIPSIQGQFQNLYQIKSEDGSIDHTINLNDDDFAINSSEILRDVLEWTYQSIMGFYKDMPATNEQDENRNILKIIKLLKQEARESIAEMDINRGTERISEGEYKLRRTENGIQEFQNSFYCPTQISEPDFKICEYAMTLLCEIYGGIFLDRNKIFKNYTLEDWEKAVEETEDFLDEVTTLTIDDIELQNIIIETIYNNELLNNKGEEEMFENNENEMNNTLNYLRYKLAREDYQNNHDLPNTESIENKGIADTDYTHEEDILQQYAEDSYISKIKDMLGLPDGEFLNRLADKAQLLFGKDVIPDIKKLQNLADLLDDTREPLDDHDHHDDGLGAK